MGVLQGWTSDACLIMNEWHHIMVSDESQHNMSILIHFGAIRTTNNDDVS